MGILTRGLHMTLGWAGVVATLNWSTLGNACTTFTLQTEKILAKSYDWHMDHGLVLINKRGVAKHGFALLPTDVPPTWTSRFGSVTFNQYGREFPNAGLNEAGLAVEVMQLDASTFPPAGPTPSLNEIQWVQYQLDLYASVDELLSHVNDVRVAKVLTPLHYLVCDKSGACATIEFLNGSPVVHTGASLDVLVLANDTYAESREYLRSFIGFGGHAPVPTGGLDSLTRFVRAADHVRSFAATDEPVSYAFRGIGKVAGDRTQWRIVYEMAKGVVHFASLGAPAVKALSTAGLDFSCAAPVLMLPMARATGGDVTADLTEFDHAANSDIMHQSLDGQLPSEVIDLALAYPGTTSCVAP